MSCPIFRLTVLSLVIGSMACTGLLSAQDAKEDPRFKPDEKAVEARMQQLAEQSPEGAELAVFLDCGRQWKQDAAETSPGVEILNGDPWVYPAALEVKDLPPTQAFLVFTNEPYLKIKLTGLDPAKPYTLGLSWWDFDANSRTQAVWAKSPDERLVKPVVHPTRLPDYRVSKQLPAEKTFRVPVTFSRDGELLIVIQKVGTGNIVLNELWLYQEKSE